MSSAAMFLFVVLFTSACLLAEAQQAQPVAGQTVYDEIVVESTLFVKGKSGTGRQGKSRTLESVSTDNSTPLVDRSKRDVQQFNKAKVSKINDEAWNNQEVNGRIFSASHRLSIGGPEV